MAGPNAQQESDEEQPLDPATERVRRKLVRFMAINLAILFAAVMAVVLALVYKSVVSSTDESAQRASSSVPSRETLSGSIQLPAGARILSQALSGDRLTLHLRLESGGEAILLYDMASGRSLGQFDIVRQEP